MAESINTPIKNILRMYKGQSIELCLDRIHNYLNHTINTSLGCSPFEIISCYSSLDPLKRDCSDRVQKKLKAFKSKKEAQTKTIGNYKFKVNDLVLVKTHSADKLDIKY